MQGTTTLVFYVDGSGTLLFSACYGAVRYTYHYTYAATSLIGDCDLCQLLEAATGWRPVQPSITPARFALFSPLPSCSFRSSLLSTMGSVCERPYDTSANSQVAKVEHAKYRTSTGGSIIGNATAKTNRVLDSSSDLSSPSNGVRSSNTFCNGLSSELRPDPAITAC
jgi:hypothetical protein